jgi:hypothetical protein
MRVANAKRSIGRGLARVEAGTGTLISFASKEGTVASDGNGRNSPFTAGLLAHISEPGLEIQFLMRKVRDSVLASTNNEQEPFISASLSSESIYLVPPLPGSSVANPIKLPPDDPIARDYEAAKKVGTAEAWDAFVARHGSESGNSYVELARSNAENQRLAAIDVTPFADTVTLTEDLVIRKGPGDDYAGVEGGSSFSTFSAIGRTKPPPDDVAGDGFWVKVRATNGREGFLPAKSLLRSKKAAILDAYEKQVDRMVEGEKNASGPLKGYSGLYTFGSCDNLRSMLNGEFNNSVAMLTLVQWFEGNTIYSGIMYPKDDADPYPASTMRFLRVFRSNTGNLNLYTHYYKGKSGATESEILGFNGGKMQLIDKLTAKRITYKTMNRCSIGDLEYSFKSAARNVLKFKQWEESSN